jgi:hypothetical protein
MDIGKIVEIRSIDEYVVELNEGEIDHGILGKFLKVDNIVCIGIDIFHERPEFVKYMGKLSWEEIKKFLPDVVSEKLYLRVIPLGMIDGELSGDIPSIGSSIVLMDEEEIRKFHTPDGKFQLAYYIKLLKKLDENSLNTIMALIFNTLRELFPEKNRFLDVIEANLEYVSKIREMK